MERITLTDTGTKAGRFTESQDIKGAIDELRFRLDDARGVSVAFPETPEVVEMRPGEKAEQKAEVKKPAAEKAAEVKPAEVKKPVEEKAAAEKPVEEKKPVVEKAAAEKPVEEKKPLIEKPAVEKTAETVKSVAPAAAAKPAETKAPAVPEKPAIISSKVKFGVEPILPYSMEEAINRLRINISFLGGDVKKIMIVSSEPNEGKSFVAMNLWKQMAISGVPSILLDLDMRKSNLVPKYQMEREDGKELKGMTHFLSGNEPVENMILHTFMEHGDILPNVDNVINPSMLLESRKFGEMMKYMEEHYRYVFVDVPPLGLVSDGELIGNACDGALLCVRGGVTSRAIVRRSIRQIERAGCQVLGIVLNRVGGNGSGYYHKYYGKKYYYNDQYYSKG